MCEPTQYITQLNAQIQSSTNTLFKFLALKIKAVYSMYVFIVKASNSDNTLQLSGLNTSKNKACVYPTEGHPQGVCRQPSIVAHWITSNLLGPEGQKLACNIGPLCKLLTRVSLQGLTQDLGTGGQKWGCNFFMKTSFYHLHS